MAHKIALITGGSRGLGKNAALHLARTGVDIILTYHSRKDEAEKTVQEITQIGRRAYTQQLDVSKVGKFQAFATHVKDVLKEKFNRTDFDYLINNAGTGVYAPFIETTEEQFDDLVNVHLKATFFLTQKMLPLMADGGRIVNISSGLARMSLPGYSAYATMKGGIETLSRYMAKELGPRGITVNVIAPGAIETDFNGGRVRDDAELNKTIAGQTALGRVGLPDDIGGAIAMLLRDENRWITAQRIEVSGGQGL